MTPDFTRSAQTTALIELLRTAMIGTVVRYSTMSDAIGEDILDCRHHLYTATKALNEEGLAFGTVRTEGVKRLASEEVPAIGESALLHIRRTGTRARRRLGVISRMNDVPNDVSIKVNACASLLGVIEHFSANKTRKSAEAEVEKVKTIIPPMKFLEALR